MVIVKFIQDGIIYKCTRDSINALYDDLKYLAAYVEKV